MCRSQLLHQTDHGCVSLCATCNKIQLCFGTTVTVHSDTEFTAYCGMISGLLDKHSSALNRQQKSIFISTPIEHLMLVFSIEDIEQLNDLLSQASAMLEVRAILEHNSR